MSQLEFIPLRVLEYKPNPQQTTLHQTGVALCDDGLRYYVKGIDGDASVCACEWIGSSFARSLNLPVPVSKVLQLPGGPLIFGSQAVSNSINELDSSMLLLGGMGNAHVPNLRGVLSAAYALDQLIGNVDRHDRNFILQRAGVLDGQEIVNVHLIDYASSTLLDEAVSEEPLNENCWTVKYGRDMRRAHGFSLEHAKALLSGFAQGRQFLLDTALMGLPLEWLSKSARTSLIDKIMSAKFGQRIENVSLGMSTGAYL